MAEFLNQPAEPPLMPMNAMGKPIPYSAREVGLEHCKQMGLDSAQAWRCVEGVSYELEKDRPYQAMAVCMKYLDLTGAYRLFAVLLVAASEVENAPAHS